MSNNNSTTYIYFLRDPRTFQVRYIGKTTDTRQRYNHHLSFAHKTNTHCGRWIAQLLAVDLKPIMEIVVEVPPDGDWQAVEKAWIEWGRVADWPLTNITDGGEGTLGRILSAEARKKLSEARRGKTFSLESRARMSEAKRNMSPETRAKISEALRGKPLSPETREKMSVAQRGNTHNKGKTHSPETRAKMSKIRQGKPFSPEHCAKLSAAAKAREARKRNG